MKYKSDITTFIENLKVKNPNLDAIQQERRKNSWKKSSTAKENLLEPKLKKIKRSAYVYYSY